MATKVSKNFINNIDPSQINSGGAINGQVLTYNATTASWAPSGTGAYRAGDVSAWVRFDGTKDTTGATSTSNTNRLIIAQSNVSSVMRNSTGNYTINFTNSMPTTAFAAIANIGQRTAISQAATTVYAIDPTSTSNVQIVAHWFDGSTYYDYPVHAVIFA